MTENPTPANEAAPMDDETITLLAELVAIESVNPDLVPGASGESAIADYCAVWLTAHGLEVHRLESRPGRPSVVGIARGSGGGRSLMLNGHYDTVSLAGYDGDPLAPRVADGKLYGRGSFDMKSGLAAAMVATVQAARQPLRGDVLVACVADEEHSSWGTQEVLAPLHGRCRNRDRAESPRTHARPQGIRLVRRHHPRACRPRLATGSRDRRDCEGRVLPGRDRRVGPTAGRGCTASRSRPRHRSRLDHPGRRGGIQLSGRMPRHDRAADPAGRNGDHRRAGTDRDPRRSRHPRSRFFVPGGTRSRAQRLRGRSRTTRSSPRSPPRRPRSLVTLLPFAASRSGPTVPCCRMRGSRACCSAPMAAGHTQPRNG